MTSLQQSLSAMAGSTFAAVDMIFMRQSLSIGDSHYFAAAIARRNHVAADDMTSLQQLAAITSLQSRWLPCSNRCRPFLAATSPQQI